MNFPKDFFKEIPGVEFYKVYDLSSMDILCCIDSSKDPEDVMFELDLTSITKRIYLIDGIEVEVWDAQPGNLHLYPRGVTTKEQDKLEALPSSVLKILSRAKDALDRGDVSTVVSEIFKAGVIDPAYLILLSNTQEELILMLRWNIAILRKR